MTAGGVIDVIAFPHHRLIAQPTIESPTPKSWNRNLNSGGTRRTVPERASEVSHTNANDASPLAGSGAIFCAPPASSPKDHRGELSRRLLGRSRPPLRLDEPQLWRARGRS